MSFADSFVVALKVELVKIEPEVLSLSELGVTAICRAASVALLAVAPPILRVFAAPLLNMATTEIEKLADEELEGLLPVKAQASIGARTLALTIERVFPADLPKGPAETVADWPTERNQD